MPVYKYNDQRTNLFLLRVWCERVDPGENKSENEHGDKHSGSGQTWHGRVQRTVSGEAHNFEDKETLIEVLERMLYKDRPD